MENTLGKNHGKLWKIIYNPDSVAFLPLFSCTLPEGLRIGGTCLSAESGGGHSRATAILLRRPFSHQAKIAIHLLATQANKRADSVRSDGRTT